MPDELESIEGAVENVEEAVENNSEKEVTEWQQIRQSLETMGERQMETNKLLTDLIVRFPTAQPPLSEMTETLEVEPEAETLTVVQPTENVETKSKRQKRQLKFKRQK